MDKNALLTAMKASISEVLETMFFMPVDFVTDGNAEAAETLKTDMLVSELAFDGPVRGRFRLVVPESLTRDISSDFLGIDPGDLTADDVTGTIKEMINMLAGNTLSAYDANVMFDLGVPQMVIADTGCSGGAAQQNRLGLEIQTLSSRMTMMVDYCN